jgi:hypothetical protein
MSKDDGFIKHRLRKIFSIHLKAQDIRSDLPVGNSNRKVLRLNKASIPSKLPDVSSSCSLSNCNMVIASPK